MARRADLHDDVDERLDVGRLRAPHALEQREALQLAQHPVGLVAAERRDAEGDVAEHLDEHAAEADHHDRPEERVLGDADDHLDAAGDLLADEDAVDAGRSSRPRGAPCASARRTSRAPPCRRRRRPSRARGRSCAAGRATRSSSRPGTRAPSPPGPPRPPSCTARRGCGLMPYASSSSFDSCSESAPPGSAPPRIFRALFAAGSGSVGASANGER